MNNSLKTNTKNLSKKKIIKLNKNKLFASSNTNSMFKNKNIKIVNNNSSVNNLSYINKSLDLNEKSIDD